MIYRMIVSIGLFTLGYYLGREVGRTEAIREQLGYTRGAGGSVNFREAVVVDMEPSEPSNEK